MSKIGKSFEECAKDEMGKVYVDSYENGVRYIIMRGTSSLCAYVGVPDSHPLAGHDYELINLAVHGGLTFSSKGDEYRPAGYWWYGWDYGHSGDKSFYDLQPELQEFNRRGDKAWTPDDVQDEIWIATWNFKKLVDLAELIAKEQK